MNKLTIFYFLADSEGILFHNSKGSFIKAYQTIKYIKKKSI